MKFMKCRWFIFPALGSLLMQACNVLPKPFSLLFPVPPVPEAELESFSYSETSMSAFPDEDYEVKKLEDGRVQLSRLEKKHDGYRESYYVGPEVLDSIKQIMQEEKMMGYKSHYQTLMDVRDGTMWSLTARFADGTYLSSGGYMSWPSGNGIKRVREYVYSIQSDEKAPVEYSDLEKEILSWRERDDSLNAVKDSIE